MSSVLISQCLHYVFRYRPVEWNEATWWDWQEVNDGEIVDEKEFDVMTAPAEEVWIEEDSDTQLEDISGSVSVKMIQIEQS